jgi:glycopeptide antibiotics resistance protein
LDLTFDIFGLIASVLFVTIFLPLGWKRKYPPRRIIFVALVFLYLMALIKTTLFPIPLVAAGEPRVPNLVPFQTIYDLWQAGDPGDLWANIGGNLLLLMPAGFFLAWGIGKRLPFAALFGIAFLITLLIEFWQLLISSLIGFSYRTFDVDDLLLNTVGLLAAYFFTFALRKHFFLLLGASGKGDIDDLDRQKTAV